MENEQTQQLNGDESAAALAFATNISQQMMAQPQQEQGGEEMTLENNNENKDEEKEKEDLLKGVSDLIDKKLNDFKKDLMDSLDEEE